MTFLKNWSFYVHQVNNFEATDGWWVLVIYLILQCNYTKLPQRPARVVINTLVSKQNGPYTVHNIYRIAKCVKLYYAYYTV